ncbi:hypothetical protein S83_045269 [Arachis hypogaea]
MVHLYHLDPEVAFLIYRPVMRLLRSQRSPDGSQAYILDDIIDHVKYLQLQLKELSGSRLQAESTAIPLVFHECRSDIVRYTSSAQKVGSSE